MLVDWLSQDGIIAPDEAERTISRCAAGTSAQPPLQRLSVVGMTRASDGTTLTLDALSEWLAEHLGMEYRRIDPMKVDVGNVAVALSAAYAERHRVLPVLVSASEVVVATSEPGLTEWVPEVERQSRRTVRLVVSNPLDIKRYTTEFFALAK
ncbi:MAG: type II/IV secretion system protein, partial [Burkholderiaceae bacterium]